MKVLEQLKELERMGSPMRLAAEEWTEPWQTLISTILSARTRDEVTIPTANSLFKIYRTSKSLANANIKDVQKIIRPINFYKTKSKNIKNCAKILVKNYNGKPPLDFDKLLELPGVGRKTANVFLIAMGRNSLAVDTHVAFISQRLGWTRNKEPAKIEEDLKKLFPEKYWMKVNSILVVFGKTYTNRKEKNALLERIKKI